MSVDGAEEQQDVARFDRLKGIGDRLRSAAPAGDRRGARASGSDAVRLIIQYLKQETVQPLTGLGRYLLFGVAGSLAIAVGTVVLLIAALRLLQGETGTFHGNLTWIPYLIVIALAAVLAALSVWRVTAGPARRRRPKGD